MLSSAAPCDPFQTAMEHHRTGRIAAAEKCCREILSRNPANADALHLLGIIALQSGRIDVALGLFHRAVQARPVEANFHGNLGRALWLSGNRNGSIAAFRRAAELRPADANRQIDLANAIMEAGEAAVAIVQCRQALAIHPRNPELLYLLACALLQNGDTGEAIPTYRAVLQVDPHHGRAQNNLGNLLFSCGQVEDAVTLYRGAIDADPSNVSAYSNLGNALVHQGKHKEAVDCLHKAVALDPNSAAAHFNLGNACYALGEFAQARSAYEEAVRLDPQNAEAWNGLGNMWEFAGEFEAAEAAYGKAFSLNPENPAFLNNLGNAFKYRGALDQALHYFRRAVALRPDLAIYHSNLVYALAFHPDFDSAAILAEARHWEDRHAAPLRRYVVTSRNDPSPDRKLRIGFVSPNFAEHVVGANILSFLKEHDRNSYAIHGYFNAQRSDARTEQIRSLFDGWQNIFDLSDELAADAIRADRIDILVDLTLHMACNRLLVFARKPAPVQATYLGYCGTTGLKAIDYRVSDPYFDPPGSDLTCYSEKTIQLPRSYWCYEPLGPVPEVNALPAGKEGHVTFGCLNNFAKVSRPTLDLWMEILRRVPRARLLLHAPVGRARDGIVDRFRGKGIAAERVEFVSRQSWDEYLRTLQRLDIALDPFPHAGGISSCDAIWMGVPIVTLNGRTALGRAGVSILSNIGLHELIANDSAQYVEIAATLAGNLYRLSELRGNLRSMMERSPLRDAPGHARDLEAAFREMWHAWCSGRY